MRWGLGQAHGKAVFFIGVLLIILLFADVSFTLASSEHELAGTVQQKASAKEFSARLIWRRGGKTSKALLFVKGDRYRIEHFGGVKTDLGFAEMTIVRLDKQKVWYVYSQRRLVVSVPATGKDVLPFSVRLDGEVSRTLIGDASAGGRPAQLYELEVLTPVGQREKYYQWVDVDRHVLLKLLSQERDWWVEYEHVVVSKQPDYYFEAPLGYRKVEAQEIQPKQQG